MVDAAEAIKLLNETYDLKDLTKEDVKIVQVLRGKINKLNGIMSLRSKKINMIEVKVRELIRR